MRDMSSWRDFVSENHESSSLFCWYKKKTMAVSHRLCFLTIICYVTWVFEGQNAKSGHIRLIFKNVSKVMASTRHELHSYRYELDQGKLTSQSIEDTARKQLQVRVDTVKGRRKTSMVFVNNKALDEIKFQRVSPNVHIFYYIWYGNPKTDGKYIHWNHKYLPHWRKEIAKRFQNGAHIPPDDIGSDFYPQLGCYSSSDVSTIKNHMEQIRSSGAGVVVVSWYPAGKADDQGIPVDGLVPKLLDIAHDFGLKVTLHIEPYNGRNEETLRKDVIYIHENYFKHPAFYKHRTRDDRLLPLLYIYDSYHTSPQEWAELLKPEGRLTIRNTRFDCVMIALIVEFTHRDFITIGGFDGFYTYFAVNGFTYGSRWSAWSALASFATQTDTIFIPSVAPGYTDISIRPWNYENTRSRNNGEYYRRSFQAALAVQPKIISITSFNEWHEGTQIETAIPKSRNGFSYHDYFPNQPDYYLKITSEYVERFLSKKQDVN